MSRERGGSLVSNDLDDSMYDCLKILKNSVDEGLKDGKLKMIEEEYLVDHCTNPESEEPGYGVEVKIEKVRAPDFRRTYYLLEDFLNKDESCQRVLSHLVASREGMNDAQARGLLFQVFNRVTTKMMDAESSPPLSDAALKGLANDIADELANNTRIWNVSAFLTGLAVKGPVQVGDLFSLRRVKVKDTLRRIPHGQLILSTRDPFPLFREPLVGSALLELSQKCTDTMEIQRFIMHHLHMLRLFRVGSVGYSRLDSYPDSYHYGSSSQGLGQPTPLSLSFEFSESDIDGYLRFEAELGPFVRTAVEGKNQELGSLAIGLSRYDSALFESSNYQIRIVNSISALEAVLLSDSSELSYKLRMRASALIGCDGSNPTEARDCIKKCYSIRSNYMHGKPLNSSLDLPRLSRELLEILRKVLVLSLRARSTMTHEDFVALIDDALISDEGRSALASSVAIARGV